MNKKEIIASVAQRIDYTKKDTDEVIEAFLATIIETLEQGEKVVLSGFGTFEMKTRDARQIPNPLTGKMMDIPKKKAISFKAAKSLKEDN